MGNNISIRPNGSGTTLKLVVSGRYWSTTNNDPKPDIVKRNFYIATIDIPEDV